MNVLTVTLHPAIDRFIKVAQLLPNRSVSCEVLKTYSSGKGINAARVLQRLGILATATGFQEGALFLNQQLFELLTIPESRHHARITESS